MQGYGTNILWMLTMYMSMYSSARPDDIFDERHVRDAIALRQQSWPSFSFTKPAAFTIAVSMDENQAVTALTECPLSIELRGLSNDGVSADIEVRLTNRSEKAIEVYNPSLNGLLMWKQGYSFAVLRSDGTFIGDLLYSESGSSRTPSEEDWIRLRAGSATSSRFAFKTGYVPGTQYAENRLPAGKYYLELRAHTPALSGVPRFVRESRESINHPTYSEWIRNFPGHIICRSNRVDLDILP
jgi:hypothetical protein